MKIFFWVPLHEELIRQRGGEDAIIRYHEKGGDETKDDQVRQQGGEDALQFVQLLRSALVWDFLFIGSASVLAAAVIQLVLVIQSSGLLTGLGS